MTPMLFVTDPGYGSDMGQNWNPWRSLRARDHILFALSQHAKIGGGAIYARRGDLAAIVIDPDLGRVDRNAALAHELVHDERGGIPIGAPDWIVRKEERSVDLEVAVRLVPVDDLLRFCLARATVGPVSVADVAGEFEVPEPVARRALLNMGRSQ